MRKVYVILMLALISRLASAGYVQSIDLNISEVLTGYSHKGVFVESSVDLPNPENCPEHSYGSPRLVAVIPDRNNVDHVLSIALAAKVSNSLVDI